MPPGFLSFDAVFDDLVLIAPQPVRYDLNPTSGR
jgi:hypothetical protein